MMIVIKIDDVLATRPWVKYLGRRPYRAALILSNLINLSRSFFYDRSIIDYSLFKEIDDVLVRLIL